MPPRLGYFLLIALFPVYISLGLYPIPQLNLSTLLRFPNLNSTRIFSRALFSPANPTTATLIREQTMSPTKIVPRPSEERGNADHGWLKTFHTFSFARYVHTGRQKKYSSRLMSTSHSYQGSGFEQFGALRVINEDRVAPRTGFGTHSHREFEIFSYIVSGELEQ